MKRPQAALFDRLAAGAALYAYPAESLWKLDALADNKGRVLDAGCGDGTIARALTADSVVGFDVSRRCAALARRKGVPALVADGTQALPFRSGAFDTVYCIDVLHHLEGKWEIVLSEFDRVLHRGGRLVVVEPDARNPFVRWTQAPGSLLRVAPFDNEPAIDPEALLPLLSRRGYTATCTSVHIDGEQVERSVFPMWQRLAKAPFVYALAFWFGSRPNKFAIVATKPG